MNDSARPPTEDDEDVPAAALPTNRLLRPRRAIVATVTLVIVFGITASLVLIGINRVEQIEPTPAVQKDASISLTQPGSLAAPVDPPKPLDSLMLDATRSYLTSNAQAPTDIERSKLCLSIEDGYKERLDCYDGIFAPDPKPKPPVAKLAADYRISERARRAVSLFQSVFSTPKASQSWSKSDAEDPSPQVTSGKQCGSGTARFGRPCVSSGTSPASESATVVMPSHERQPPLTWRPPRMAGPFLRSSTRRPSRVQHCLRPQVALGCRLVGGSAKCVFWKSWRCAPRWEDVPLLGKRPLRVWDNNMLARTLTLLSSDLGRRPARLR